jgi:DtxR family Mn-dependent transcriptional regulator
MSEATGSHRREVRERTSEAIEDYAKAIHAIEARDPGPVGTSALAERLGVSPGTVTAMLKRMAAMGLLTHEPYRGVELTESGRLLALEVIRHHRLIESFLAEALDMPWDRVHDEAEVLEHYISEDLEQRMAAALGNPSHDPHGDPIPSPGLEMAADHSAPLSSLAPGEAGTFVRVSDADPGKLRYLAERGIAPGHRIEFVEQEPYGGPGMFRIGEELHPLGPELIAAMRVECPGGPTSEDTDEAR